ncbi:WS/DGAT/MGAT family acyltransferase [Actinomycetospora succinea]|uniref:diacylglycerol O-acyltransferase n=1 Tax=Actinomycetospora succinea TaxID=663603 RepID=A0A4R6UW70_9PSEU|nr:wax ester/triacylglycerol synthase domain-containing protein [Actinomycetospora succinea]TDQ50229.1 WS/DGAT/MGAT family acyltransferase [Actinomycetospora succinea]
MDRWASGIDTAWLQLEQPTNRMVVHGILFCEGPVDITVLRERVRDRWVAAYPGLRQRPTWPVGRLGPARWVDAPPDLDEHVRAVELAAPGDDAALARHVGAVMSQPLPADRPWWSLHLVSGYEGGAALLVNIHHGLADGVALNHLFHVLSDDPAAEGTPAAYAEAPRRPRRAHDWRLLHREVRDRVATLRDKVRAAGSDEGAAELRATGRAVRTSTAMLARPPQDAPSSLLGEPGTAKSARWTSVVPLETVKAAGKPYGASVNDVLCAAIAGALRSFAGDELPRLRAVMPINMRPLDRPISDELGNEVGLVLPPLPTDEADPGRRVERVHAAMETIKRTNQGLATFAGIAGSGHGRPAWTRALVARYATTSSVIISNVPGPVAPLRIAGTRVRDALFWVPCSGHLALGVSILSYAGRVRLGVRADTGILGGEDGVDRFVAALDEQLAAM